MPLNGLPDTIKMTGSQNSDIHSSKESLHAFLMSDIGLGPVNPVEGGIDMAHC